MMRAPVNRIIPFSNVDDPGNRTALFFQGCPYNCLYCHNPETIHMCVHCGACVPGCPAGALSVNEAGKVVWDMKACVGCDACIRTCPNDASPRVRWMTVDDVLAELRRAAPYIDGVTTSGGDCTLYAEFLVELFGRARELGKTSLIDSNGAYDFEKGAALLEACDGVMLDVKAVEEEWCVRLVGQPPEGMLRNLDYLLQTGKLQEVRTVIFPDRDRDNAATVRYVAERIGGACDYTIIRYRPFGVRARCQAQLGEEETDPDYAERFARLARDAGASRAFVV